MSSQYQFAFGWGLGVSIQKGFVGGLFLEAVKSCISTKSAELKQGGYFLEQFWQADLGFIGQAIIGVQVPNSSHVASIQHQRVLVFFCMQLIFG